MYIVYHITHIDTSSLFSDACSSYDKIYHNLQFLQ